MASGRGVEKMQPLPVQAAGEHHLQHGGGEIPLGPGLLGKVADGPVLQRRGVLNGAALGLDQS